MSSHDSAGDPTTESTEPVEPTEPTDISSSSKAEADQIVVDDADDEVVAEDELGVEVVDAFDDDEAAAPDAGEDPQVVDESIQAYFGHREPVYSVAVNPLESSIVASGGGNDRVAVWDAGDGDNVLLEGEHAESVVALGWNFDGTLLASAALDGVVKVWDTTNGVFARTLEGPTEAVNWLAWHPKGNALLCGSEDFTAWIWLAHNGRCVSALVGHGDHVSCGMFSPDGKAAITGSLDQSVRVWNPRTGEAVHNISGSLFHRDPIVCLDVHSNSSLCISGGMNGQVHLANIATGKAVAQLKGHKAGESVESAAFCPHLPIAATAGMDGQLMLWDLDRTMLRQSIACDAPVIKCLWHPKEPTIFTACHDGTLRLYDGRLGSQVKVWVGHQNMILDLALSNDGMMALTGSDDQVALVWDTSDRE